jgi:(1->4)-alpha-D-glucan 1-alpha-D-glucosylmutase
MKFQQLTGPAAAKGIEDTAFYNFNRLISLNEVGGDPGKFGASVEEFHRHNRYISEHWPHTLLATATHDTKRGEDARARINVLSELPGEWGRSVRRWARMNSRWKTEINEALVPDPKDEILFYQTLVGSWNIESPAHRTPGAKDRLVSFMLKAVREAKAHTSWTDPNPNYEKAVAHFVTRVLDPSQNNSFLEDFAGFQLRIAFFGCFNSLSQLLLKLTSPGVPDTYQGCELWDLNLVDPDNRRSVEYGLREEALDHLHRAVQKAGKLTLAQELLRDLPDARIKLFVLWQALQLRSENPDFSQHPKYIPLNATGPAAQHLIAFARKSGKQTVITIVPRLCATLADRVLRPPIGPDLWKGTFLRLPTPIGNHSFENVFTAEVIKRTRSSRGFALSIAESLNAFPVALLVGEPPVNRVSTSANG